jgi:hypothetical protein
MPPRRSGCELFRRDGRPPDDLTPNADDILIKTTNLSVPERDEI